MKIHYSCMPNIKPKISTHNKKKELKKPINQKMSFYQQKLLSLKRKLLPKKHSLYSNNKV